MTGKTKNPATRAAGRVQNEIIFADNDLEFSRPHAAAQGLESPSQAAAACRGAADALKSQQVHETTKISPRLHAVIVHAGVKRVLARRLESADGVDPQIAVRALALCLGREDAGPYATAKGAKKKFAKWPGLTADSLKESLRRIGIKSDDALIDDALGYASRTDGSLEAIGKILRLTAAERKAARAYNLIANDETDEERAERKRVAHAERQTKYRRANGARPREEYEANSLSLQKPWEKDGITRRTWERRRKAAERGVVTPCAERETAAACAHVGEAACELTETGESRVGSRRVATPCVTLYEVDKGQAEPARPTPDPQRAIRVLSSQGIEFLWDGSSEENLPALDGFGLLKKGKASGGSTAARPLAGLNPCAAAPAAVGLVAA